jgi:SAM-dependent methyltransferase
MKCRHCTVELTHTFLDLGYAPPSNAYLTESDLSKPESYYPLKVMVCDQCWLVQTEDYTEAGDLFNADYAYFSSTSAGWLTHSAHYAEKVISEFALDSSSLVIEVASNDGYLLKNFVAAGIPCLGIEPTASTAAAAENIGVPVLREFFGEDLAERLRREGKQADLIVGNNVYAHVPDINDFTRGLKAALKKGGTITLEFPHLMQLIRHTQFDTIYHEHFSYLSLYAVSRIFEKAGLKVWNIEELSTHGGSLRVYGCHQNDCRPVSRSVKSMLERESKSGLQCLSTYYGFQIAVDRIKDELLLFLLDQKKQNKLVAAYGAAAKGNTLLNYSGVKNDLLKFVCDAAAAKQGKYLPGSHIPIFSPEEIVVNKPDFLLILPWNIAQEVREQNSSIRDWGGKFVTAVPTLEIS